MTAQTIEQKAHAYLIAGKVRVQWLDGETEMLVHVRGSGEKPYVVRCREGVWSCDCPAHVLECAHVIAAALVVPEHGGAVVPTLSAPNEELDAMFDKSAPIEPAAGDFVEWPE